MVFVVVAAEDFGIGGTLEALGEIWERCLGAIVKYLGLERGCEEFGGEIGERVR